MSNCPFESKNCPDESQLTDLLMGQLDEASEAMIETCVSRCTVCEQKLACLSDSEEIQRWQQLLSGDGAMIEFSAEQKIQQAIERSVGGQPKRPQQITAELEAAGFLEIKKIGSGGMGVVYKARQSKLNRTVAIKVLRYRSGDVNQHERILREAEAIAKIKHENVLQIHDVGEINDQPYLVFEFIDGPSLNKLAARQPQDPNATAMVVYDIAKGIAAAHRLGIVHRDIKPANILMSPKHPHESESALNAFVPKVADFGLAKEIHHPNEETRGITQTNQLLGTPSYMSPEQIAGQRETIGLQSDVYSIGVMLYELLSGSLPFTEKSPYQLLKNIEKLEPISLRRQNRNLPVDLEAICFKCLEKNPQRRYANAELVADDLERFLTGNSVLAKTPNGLNRTNKWIRRNPMATLLVATVLTSAIVGVFAWANFTRELSRLNQSLAEQNDRLVKQKQITEEVNSFLQNDLLKQAATEFQMQWQTDAGQGPGSYTRDPSLREILKQAAARLARDDTVFEDQPEIKGSLLRTIGETYLSLGIFDSAHEFLTAAIEVFPEQERQLIAETERKLAHCNMATANFLAAEELLYSSQKKFVDLGGDFEIDVLNIDRDLAEVNIALRGDLDKSLELARSAYEDLKEILGDSHPDSLAAATTLGKIKLSSNQTVDALKLLRFVSDETQAQMGPAHPVALAARFELSNGLIRTLDLDRAGELRTEVLQLAEDSLGADHPITLYYQIFASRNIWENSHKSDNADAKRKQLIESVALLEHSKDRIEQLYHPTHPIHFKVAAQLSSVYPRLGRNQELYDLCDRLIERLSINEEWNYDRILSYRLVSCRALVGMGKYEEAISRLSDCLADLKASSSYGPGHELTADAQRMLGNVYMKSGQLDFAAEHLERTYQTQCEIFGADHQTTRGTGLTLMLCLKNNQDHESLLKITQHVLQNLRPDIPKNQNVYLTLRQTLGHSLLMLKQFERAEPIFREVVDVYLQNYPDRHQPFQFMAHHGVALLELQRYDEAEKRLLQAWGGLGKTVDSTPSKAWRLQFMSSIARNLKKLYAKTDDSENEKIWEEKLNSLTNQQLATGQK